MQKACQILARFLHIIKRSYKNRNEADYIYIQYEVDAYEGLHNNEGGFGMNNHEAIVICRCEEVTYGQLLSTVEKHQCTARELKLRTRAGMGFCGGRTCRMMIERIIENVLPHTNPSEIPLKYQPPIRPVSFGAVGENND